MMENLYFSVRLIDFIMQVTVVSLLINAIFSPNKSSKWYLAKKLIKPILIFSATFLGASTIYFGHATGLFFVDLDLYPAHWTKVLTQLFMIYAFWSCLDAFTPDNDRRLWNWYVWGVFGVGAISFLILQSIGWQF